MSADPVATTMAAAPAKSAAVAGDDPLGFMQKVNDDLYYCAPGGPVESPSPSPSAKPPPRLVVMTSWMGAQPLHIAKYLAPYLDGRLFAPGNRPAIVLLRCSEANVFSDTRPAAVVTLAASLVRSFVDTVETHSSGETADPATPPTVLVHTFSNGGCKMLAHLYIWLDDPVEHTSALPPHVTLFDSSPGHVGYSVFVAALSVSLRSQPWIVQMLARPLLHAYVALGFLSAWARTGWGFLAAWWQRQWRRWQGQKPLSSGDRSPALTPGPYFFWTAHNDRTPLGGNRREVRRAYLYSFTDALIPGKQVEAHAAEATAAGFAVARMEVFPNSPHVAHARTDGPRYWKTVSDVWAGV